MKQAKTNKGQFNAIVKEAQKINEQLRKLQAKAQELAEACRDFGDNYDYGTYVFELANLEQTAEDLSNFDLEDSIPQLAKYNF